MRKELNLMSKGTGDCQIAGLEYQLKLETIKEAQDIVDIFHKEFNLVKRPQVKVYGNATRLRGTANVTTGVLHLRNSGFNVGVLIHEIAHFDERAERAYKASGGGFTMSRSFGMRRKSRNMHGHEFKFAQTEMLLYWRRHLEKKYDIKDGRQADDREKLEAKVLRRGDKVHFESSKNGEVIDGYVKRVNTKTISIQPKSGGKRYWRVSPRFVKKGWHGSTKEVEIIHIPMPKTVPKVEPTQEPVVDTDEEIKDMIQGLMDGLSKYAVYNTLSMKGIVKCLWVNGVKNTDRNRKMAIDYVKGELNLSIR